MKLFAIGLIVCLSLSIYAQKDPEDYTIDGFVVLKDSPNDTLFGKVRKRNSYVFEHLNAWLLHPDGEIEKYKVRDLSAVGRGDDLFLVKEKLPKGFGTQLLKVGARGTITLYELHNNAGATYFLMKEGQEKMQVLRDLMKGTGKYKDQKKMKAYFADDPEILAKIESTAYTPALAPAAVREYNKRHPHSGNGIH